MISVIQRSQSIHEHLLHRVAEMAGLYNDAGLEVELTDGRGSAWREASAAPDAVTVAAGGVIAEWLRGDRSWQLHFIGTVRPLMWVVGVEPVREVSELEGRSIAVPPRTDMPTRLLSLMLDRHDLDSRSDVELIEVERRPDRLGFLRDGRVDAALLGPEGLRVESGAVSPALYVGGLLEFPTVGLAARTGFDPAVADALANAYAVALERLRQDPELGVSTMMSIEPEVSDEVARHVLANVIVKDWDATAWAREGHVGDVPAIGAELRAASYDDLDLREFLHGWAVAR